MPLARRLTRHLGRTEMPIPVRSPTSGKEISLPINLLSSTNALSFAAPDLAATRKAIAFANANPPSPASSDSSSCPSEDCESGLGSPTPPSLTDASSIENSPVSEQFAYFSASPLTKQQLDAPPLGFAAPAIPKRVPSHSKREHERLARKRSLRTSNPSLLAPPTPASASAASPTSPLYFPFRSMDQVVEDSDDDVAAQDAAYMLERGLCKFDASDYSAAIGSPAFPLSPLSARAWI